MDDLQANHKTLMGRVNGTEPEERRPLDRVPGPWRNFDIRQGDRRYEVIVSTRRMLDLWRKLFKEES